MQGTENRGMMIFKNAVFDCSRNKEIFSRSSSATFDEPFQGKRRRNSTLSWDKLFLQGGPALPRPDSLLRVLSQRNGTGIGSKSSNGSVHRSLTLWKPLARYIMDMHVDQKALSCPPLSPWSPFRQLLTPVTSLSLFFSVLLQGGRPWLQLCRNHWPIPQTSS